MGGFDGLALTENGWRAAPPSFSTDRKLDEIIDFSGVAAFIETPVKHSSSGTYERLAFVVAGHLDPDVLIIDEVLAVGDVAFQRKPLAKMEDVRQRGRTVLFVSHNMTAVSRPCERAILISDSSIQKDGPAAEVVSAYLASSLSKTARREWLTRVRPRTPKSHVSAVRVFAPRRERPQRQAVEH